MANSNSESGVKVFVSNLPYSTSEDELVEIFSAAGAVVEAHLFKNYDGQVNGLAIIRFENAESAATALALDRTPVGNRTMRVSQWIDRRERTWGLAR